MKKKFTAIICAILTVIAALTFTLTGCADNMPKEYYVQYTDENGLHTLSVTTGAPYVIESIPSKTGYDFTGLFDTETGGTQDVSASGASLTPFNANYNLTLYPQFKAKEYTLILDYQGAAVTGARQLTVAYDSALPALPTDPTLPHKNFKGWYTGTNCGGTQIADEYGNIPLVSTINKDNFDIDLQNIYLYAGFETKSYSVNFYSEDGLTLIKTQNVADGTQFSEIAAGIVFNDKNIKSWSKEIGGASFYGEVEENLMLYATAYSIAVSYDPQNGNEVTTTVINDGESATPPTVSRKGHTFTG